MVTGGSVTTAGEGEIRNACIVGARIEIDGRNNLTAWLDLDYGGLRQAFGGYCLHFGAMIPATPDREAARAYWFTGHFLRRCLDVAGVERWSELPGKVVRVRASYNRCHAIGHAIREDWFDPASDIRRA